MRKLQLAGQKFGYWLVIEESKEKLTYGQTHWLCQCVCGERRIVVGSSLTNNSSTSCGCAGGSRKSTINATDYLYRRFGRLVVISLSNSIVETNGRHRTAYLCHCDCGVDLVITRHALQVKNGTRSCGCLLRETRSILGLKKRQFEPHISTARMIFSQRYSDGDLQFEDFLKLSQERCFYCDIVPSTSYNKFAFRGTSKVSEYAIQNGTFTYNGLDRVDPNQPHNKNNCVPCCIICNAAKSDKSIQEFDDWITRVHKKLVDRKA